MPVFVPATPVHPGTHVVRPAPPSARTDTVIPGDTLWHLAGRFYGSAWTMKWWKIYQANVAVIGGNPNLIKPGEVLTIPPLSAPSGTAQAKVRPSPPAPPSPPPPPVSPALAITSETGWIDHVLTAIGAPETAADVHSMEAWIGHESSWDNSQPDGALFTNNPLNTTQPGFGATGSINSVGVKTYPTPSDGLQATVTAMENGDYGDILAALHSGMGMCGESLAGLSTWSGAGYSSVC